MTEEAPPEKLLKFPTEYPIKVVGQAASLLRAEIDAIFAKHAPDFDAERISERYSENGKYLSISYVIIARSEEQVTALALELAAQPHVIMVL